ncbi:AraC family transcriptional regulator [Bacteroides finegoldii]|uniref:AraC family transcriptional regulator n=1 Tax=Bacteroides finegoldii TaxID=338188 RepID=UPI0011DC97FB
MFLFLIEREHTGPILSPPKNFIKEIMYRSGFMNRSHFYKEFTKRMGVAPKDYRLHNKK